MKRRAGKARFAAMTPQERSALGRLAAVARWSNKSKTQRAAVRAKERAPAA